MLLATNWGVYEFGKRDPQFIEDGDSRDMQIRARDIKHLHELQDRFSFVEDVVYLGWGVADFQYRVYLTQANLAIIMATLAFEVDYIRFKEGARGDRKLYSLLSRMWTEWLHSYPEGSSYTMPHKALDGFTQPRYGDSNRKKTKKRWWQDVRND